MTDETAPEAPEPTTAIEEVPPPPPPTFQEWQERLQKCFIFNRVEEPTTEVPVLIGYFDEGFTPFQVFELLTKAAD